MSDYDQTSVYSRLEALRSHEASHGRDSHRCRTSSSPRCSPRSSPEPIREPSVTDDGSDTHMRDEGRSVLTEGSGEISIKGVVGTGNKKGKGKSD